MMYMFYKLSFAEWKEQLGYTDEEQAKADWSEWYGEDAKYIYEAVMQGDVTSGICGVETFAGTYNVYGVHMDREDIAKADMLETIFSGFTGGMDVVSPLYANEEAVKQIMELVDALIYAGITEFIICSAETGEILLDSNTDLPR